VRHDIQLADPRLARVVRHMQDLPGEKLFQYLDEAGEMRRLDSADVNAYLKEITGQAFTSKDFRTWAGTIMAARALRGLGPCASQARARRNIALAVETVARQLGHTKAVCRKCYIHPAVLDGYLDGRLPAARQARSEEKALIAFLRPARSARVPRSLAPLLRQSLAARNLHKQGMSTHDRRTVL
jgi:DNA topoisomerase-1